MPLDAQDVAALATALQSLITNPSPPPVNAVALKLPTFWTSRPEVWFTQVEAQFATRQISVDATKYNYVVAALDNTTAAEVEALLINPPDDNRYDALKEALISAFGKTQSQKDAELLSLSGLGDRKPTGLLRYMRSLNANPQTLMRALFLQQLPSDVRRVIASSDTLDLDELATAADRIMEASNQDHVGSPSCVSAARQPTTSSTPSSGACYYHRRFGEAAKKCRRNGCPLAHLVSSTTPAGSARQNQGNGPAGR